VNWQRRLTPDEITGQQAIEQARRDQVLLLADPQQPAPVFPPLPDCADYTRIVHGCADHAIARDAAALTHRAACTAPAVANLPDCDCTPEAAPESDPQPEAVTPPAGW
jgi:hypothetical protein